MWVGGGACSTSSETRCRLQSAPADLYEKRREVGTDVERRPEAIYLYGVDVMSTREVLSFFTEYGPVFVEWLDDSSCE